ncbi:hypothetical protein ACWF0M_36035 [Kribbella sp. NPDC055110]
MSRAAGGLRLHEAAREDGAFWKVVSWLGAQSGFFGVASGGLWGSDV